MVGGDDVTYNAAMAPVVMGSGREMLGDTCAASPPVSPGMRRLRLVARGLTGREGRSTVAVYALRGRGDACPTKWPGAAGR